MEQTRKARLRLKLLGCPYLEGLDNNVIDELLVVSQGEARKRILKWLLGKAHPMFSNSISSLAALKTEEGKIARLTEFISLLGVCSMSDYDLVKGSSSLAKQVKFINALTEAIYLSNVLRVQGTQHKIETVTNSSCMFMDSLLAKEDLCDVFKSDINLLPPDIAYVAGINIEGIKNTKIPSISDLRKGIHELSEGVTNLQSQLDSRSQSSPAFSSDSLSDSYGTNIAAIQVALSTLIQLIDDFIRCYHDDIKPWISHVDAVSIPTSPLDPISRRVHTMLAMVNQLLESSSKLEKMHLKWQEMLDKGQYEGSFNGKVTKVFQELNNTMNKV